MLSFFSALPTPASHTCPKLLTSRPGASSLGRGSVRSLTLVVSGASGLGQLLGKQGQGPSIGQPPTRTPLVLFNPTLPGSSKGFNQWHQRLFHSRSYYCWWQQTFPFRKISMAICINTKCSLLPAAHTTSLRSKYHFAFFFRKLFSNCWLFSNCRWLKKTITSMI